MISQIHIKNFKSIVDLTLDLGRVNLFIGENGCGKSNILEGVAFASVNNNSTFGIRYTVNEYTLVNKGVRIAEPILFGSSFENSIKNIEFDFLFDDKQASLFYEYIDVDFDSISEKGWAENTSLTDYRGLSKLLQKYKDYIVLNDRNFIESQVQSFEDFINIDDGAPENIKIDIYSEIHLLNGYFNFRSSIDIQKYMIYSPENSYLRKFEEEGQVKPLGARGEGLFSLLKSMAKDNGSLQNIKEYMEAIDWFEDFSIPNDLMSNEYRISIKDRYINSDLRQLDQRSANEGFLFLLFYIVLFSSKKTPQFFAIDNIEASFNPKLCARLINMLVGLSKKNEKQVLMTTHNPATLDGLDLNDAEQRLFVVRRNIDGHTIATRITEKPKTSIPMKLSEMWIKGLLGGLPDNF